MSLNRIERLETKAAEWSMVLASTKKTATVFVLVFREECSMRSVEWLLRMIRWFLEIEGSDTFDGINFRLDEADQVFKIEFLQWSLRSSSPFPTCRRRKFDGKNRREEKILQWEGRLWFIFAWRIIFFNKMLNFPPIIFEAVDELSKTRNLRFLDFIQKNKLGGIQTNQKCSIPESFFEDGECFLVVAGSAFKSWECRFSIRLLLHAGSKVGKLFNIWDLAVMDSSIELVNERTIFKEIPVECWQFQLWESMIVAGMVRWMMGLCYSGGSCGRCWSFEFGDDGFNERTAFDVLLIRFLCFLNLRSWIFFIVQKCIWSEQSFNFL